MKSKLKQAIGLTSQPVAIRKAETLPEGAVTFREGSGSGCVVAMLAAASKGKCVAFRRETVGCPGARAGLGFSPMSASMAYKLSTGQGKVPGMGFKESPALTIRYMEHLPSTTPSTYLILQPLSQINQGERFLSVVFLANADQLSALATLASYDKAELDNVRLAFGAGCAQAVLYSLCDEESGLDRCTIGLTDPSARLHLPPDILSFAIPYHRFLALEEKIAGSFLEKEPWLSIKGRRAET